MWAPYILLSALLLAFYDIAKKHSVRDNAVMPVLFLATLCGSLGFALALAVTGHLRELAMPRAQVEVQVEPGEPTDDGADVVTFLLAANPGESTRPLAKAASGGELARTMLALRLVTTDGFP